MKIHVLCFSPTGGTQKVADALAKTLGEAGKALDLTRRDVDFGAFPIAPGDVCVLAVPSFGGRVPAAALERLRAVRGNNARAVLAVAYGNRAYDDTLMELREAAKASGFRPVAAVAAVTEHSIIREYGAGRTDERDLAQLAAFGRQIAAALADGGALPEVAVPGKVPEKAPAALPMNPKAGRGCNRCGACASSCPVGAIPAQDPARTDGGRCISCMRCVAVCPQKARGLNPALRLGAQQMLKKACAEPKQNELFLGRI